MIKRIKFCLLVFLTLPNNAIFQIKEESLTISVFSKQVILRVYYMARVQRAMQLLEVIPSIKFQINNLQFEEIFKNEEVNRAFQQFIYEKDMSGLLEVWKSFTSMKNIKDEYFEFDFIKLICLVYDILKNNSFNLEKMEESAEKRKPDFCQMEAKKKLLDHLDSLLYEKGEKNSINLINREVTTDQVVFRFYIIRRVAKNLTIFNRFRLNDSEKQLDSEPVRGIDPFVELESFCQHKRVKDILKKMIKEKNLIPLQNLFNDIQSFRFVEDERFLKEMLMTMYTTYKKLIMRNLGSQTDQEVISNEITDLLELYQNIDAYSTEELLEIIDDSTSKLSVILEKMESNSWLTKLVIWIAQKINY